MLKHVKEVTNFINVSKLIIYLLRMLFMIVLKLTQKRLDC